MVLAIQEAQLAEHGGLLGIRDRGMLESALARPKNLLAYSPKSTLRQLAAAYAFGLAKNHSFVDVNKRAAWVICVLFLELNGIAVIADQAEVIRVMLGIADGTLSEEEVVTWLKRVDVTGKSKEQPRTNLRSIRRSNKCPQLYLVPSSRESMLFSQSGSEESKPICSHCHLPSALTSQFLGIELTSILFARKA